MRPTIEQGLSWAGVLVASGLAVELALSWAVHPLSFIVFLLVACPLVAGGMLLFLWTLVAAGSPPERPLPGAAVGVVGTKPQKA